MKWHGASTPRHRNELSIDYLTLRKLVGAIGMLLPLGLLIGTGLVFTNMPDSMSGYYYTDVRNLFVGTLCALGVFLISYAGFDDWDRWLTNVAGGGAILVAFCPTKPAVCAKHARICLAPAVRALSAEQNWVGSFHLAFAAVTFIALGFMALRFAKTKPEAYNEPVQPGPGGLQLASAQVPEPVGTAEQKQRRSATRWLRDAPVDVWKGLGFEKPRVDDRTPEKAKRNVVYRVCGVAILVFIALAAASNLLPQPVQGELPWFFICEALAVIAFGISWFVKGEALLKDGSDRKSAAGSPKSHALHERSDDIRLVMDAAGSQRAT